MSSYNYGNYGRYSDPYSHPSYQAARPVHPECKLTLAQLLSSPAVREDVERTLGGGGSGISARWRKVAVELSKGNKKINMTFLQDIENSHNNGPQCAKAFLNKLIGMPEITGEMFIQGLSNVLLEVCAGKLREVAAKGVPETKGPIDKGIPGAVVQIPSAALAKDEKTEELAASRARLLDVERQMQEIKRKNEEMERRLKEAQKSKPAERPAAAPDAAGDDCVICEDRKRTNIALIPCGHAAYCATCVELIKKCSLCNKVIQNRMKVYLQN